MSEWQPIETAPKDGVQILVWAHGRALTAYWSGDKVFRTTSYGFVGLDPSHWMHLPPEPPK